MLKYSVALLVFLGLVPLPAAAQDARITVELNKLEASETGTCRAFFLFRNGTEATFEEFELSIAVLDTNGVIDRLLSIDAAPLPVQRTTLKLFEIPEFGCESLSEFIVHDIPGCKPENADPVDCYGIVDWISRTDIRLGQ